MNNGHLRLRRTLRLRNISRLRFQMQKEFTNTNVILNETFFTYKHCISTAFMQLK